MTPDHINSSIARALKGESQLDPEVLKIQGFSTATMRHLFNNLCHIDGITYCEVGVFKGASFVSAFNNNPIHAIGIDDFSQDFSQGDIRSQFQQSYDRWGRTEGRLVDFYEGDCFEIASNGMLEGEIIDVLTYDGHHDTEPTARALPAFLDLLADRFLFIVDDFHWKTVSTGVQQGFATLAGRFKLSEQWTLSGNKAQDDPIFHNGLALFLCEKIK